MGLKRRLSRFSILLLASRQCSPLCSNPTSTSSTFSKKEAGLTVAFASSEYLSDRVSSPERYANALNLTVQQVSERKELYRQASETLHNQLSSLTSNSLSGIEKHTLICQHRFRYGQHPFTCPNCWTYTPICVCHIIRNRKNEKGPILLPSPRLDVVVWVHHSEWGLTSNTGGLLSLAIHDNQCRLLMKGLPAHDNQLKMDYLDNHPEECLVVLLWPDEKLRKAKEQMKAITGNNGDETALKATAGSPAESTTSTATISLDDIRSEIAAPNGRRVVLIAVDGTWRNARRMVSRLPRSIPRFDLPAEILKEYLPSTVSLLSPIRSKGPSHRHIPHGGDDALVCTAEAVASILKALGLKEADGQFILDIAKTKVELVRRYRGHESKI